MPADEQEARSVVAAIKAAVLDSRAKTRRLKVKTLMGRFGYQRRTEENTAQITRLLRDGGMLVFPSIMKLGDDWELSFEDWLYVSLIGDEPTLSGDTVLASPVPEKWNQDGWFDRIATLKLRTEKEVETKFVIPLLYRLGYDEDDRYDDMPVSAAHGSKPTKLTVDFALFNDLLEGLRNQVLLTVEAKKEDRLQKPVELQKAKNQVKSYALWTCCYFGLVTDSRVLEVYRIGRSHTEQDKTVFSCRREELPRCFPELYRHVSKNALTDYYKRTFALAEEIQG